MLVQQKQTWTVLWRNVDIATMDPAYRAPYGLIRQGALAIAGDRIAWCGLDAEVGEVPAGVQVIDAAGGDLNNDSGNGLIKGGGQRVCFTPGLIDCHTHLVFAGNRSDEFEKRLNGLSYAEISAQGGGIQNTVLATRAMSESDLLQLSIQRLACMESYGVTSVEIKSGYGLDRDTELKILRVITALKQRGSSWIQRTFLGPHALPLEFDDKQAFVTYLCQTVLPEVKQLDLADSVDVFCESIGFSRAHSEQFFRAAKDLGFDLKIHAEQLSNQGGAQLAAQYQALSADHLEYLSEQDAAQMAEAGVVAVLLPGAFYYLKERQCPPVHWLRKYQVAIALGSDFNPGSSPFISPRLIMNMGCLLMGLTVQEALLGMTRNAAQAINQGHCRGQIKAGYYADLCLWAVDSPAQLVSQMEREPLLMRMVQGRVTGQVNDGGTG